MDGRNHDFDVFVSFAAADDRPIGEGGPGCVAVLCAALQRFAKPHLKRDLRVAVSTEFPSLSGSESGTGGAVVGNPESAATLVAVLSPTYVSAISMDQAFEVEAFAASAGLGAASHMFSAVAQTIDEDQVLDVLRDRPRYGLFDEDGNETLMRAASELSKSLVAVLTGATPSPLMRSPEASASGRTSGEAPDRTVFLAQTHESAERHREDVHAELVRRGYRVVPDQPPAQDKASIVEAADRALDEADISIHLLGAECDDATRLECRQAGTKADTGALERYVWVGVDRPTDPDLVDLLDDVESASDGTHSFRNTTIETFKTSVIKALDRPRIETAPASKPDRDRKYLYLVFDQADEKWTVRLQRYLGRRCVVLTPLFEGDARAIEEQHLANLETCDASLVIYGDAPQSWWKFRTREFLNRGQPGASVDRGFYLVLPMTREKQAFSDPAAISAGEDFSREALDEFMVETGLWERGSVKPNGSAKPNRSVTLAGEK